MTDGGESKEELQASLDWRKNVREYRKKRGLSQPDIAHRSGLSLSAIKAYENGARHPSREALVAIVDALGMTVEQANPVLTGAGYATNWRAIFHQAYGPREVEWFAGEVERSGWPVFVTNEASDLIAANRAFRLLIDVPLSERLPLPEKWNLLALGSSPSYAERFENWDELMSFVLGLGKADLRSQVNPERPASWTTDAYRRFLQGDPAYVTRMLKLWDPAEPVLHTTRMHYTVRLRHESGHVMRFSGIMHVADVWQVFAWHDWIPEDAKTLALLPKVGD